MADPLQLTDAATADSMDSIAKSLAGLNERFRSQGQNPGINNTFVNQEALNKFGPLISGLLGTAFVNSSLSQFSTRMPGMGIMQNVDNMRSAGNFTMMSNAFEDILKKSVAGSSAAVFAPMITQMIKSGGVTPEALEAIDRSGLGKSPEMQKFMSRAVPDLITRGKYGTLAMFHHDETVRMQKEFDSLSAQGISTGILGSVIRNAQDFNASERFKMGGGEGETFDKDDMMGQAVAEKKYGDRIREVEAAMNHAKKLNGHSPRQVLQLMAGMYDDVITDQLDGITEFSEKMYTISQSVSDGISKLKNYSTTINQSLRAAGVNNTEFGFDYAYDKLVSSNPLMEQINSFGKKGGRVSNFNYNVAAGRAQDEATYALGSTYGHVISEVYGLFNAKNKDELAKKLEGFNITAGDGSSLGEILAGNLTPEATRLLEQGKFSANEAAAMASIGMDQAKFADAVRNGTVRNPQQVLDTFNSPASMRERMRNQFGTKIFDSKWAQEYDKIFSSDMNFKDKTAALLELRKTEGLTSRYIDHIDATITNNTVEQSQYVKDLREYLSSGDNAESAKQLAALKNLPGNDLFSAIATGLATDDNLTPKEREKYLALMEDSRFKSSYHAVSFLGGLPSNKSGDALLKALQENGEVATLVASGESVESAKAMVANSKKANEEAAAGDSILGMSGASFADLMKIIADAAMSVTDGPKITVSTPTKPSLVPDALRIH